MCKSERIGQVYIFQPKERKFLGGLRGIIKFLKFFPWMFSSTSPPVSSSCSLIEACYAETAQDGAHTPFIFVLPQLSTWANTAPSVHVH